MGENDVRTSTYETAGRYTAKYDVYASERVIELPAMELASLWDFSCRTWYCLFIERDGER